MPFSVIHAHTTAPLVLITDSLSLSLSLCVPSFFLSFFLFVVLSCWVGVTGCREHNPEPRHILSNQKVGKARKPSLATVRGSLLTKNYRNSSNGKLMTNHQFIPMSGPPWPQLSRRLTELRGMHYHQDDIQDITVNNHKTQSTAPSPKGKSKQRSTADDRQLCALKMRLFWATVLM